MHKKLFRSLFVRYIGWKYNIPIGKNTVISRRALLHHGKIKIGDNCRIASYVTILPQAGLVDIGNNVTLNFFTTIYGDGGVKIGNDCRIGAHVVMVAGDHTFDDVSIPIWQNPGKKVGIVIGEDVWIGAGARILDGAEIGKGCIIGAGAVVKGKLAPYGIYAGVPAKKIKSRI